MELGVEVEIAACFVCDQDASQVRVASTKYGRIFTSRTVSDAFEGKVYSETYISHAKGDPPGTLPVFSCELYSLTGEKKNGHTVDQYENFILQFMN